MTVTGRELREQVRDAWHQARTEQLTDFRRIAFAASPLEYRVFDGRRQGQERIPHIDADATGVP